MMSANQSGVIACHSISTTRPEATPRKSVPFKAWPEIKEWERYYLLPTVKVIYRPELLLDPTDASLSSWGEDWTLEGLIEKILNSSPDFEQFASQFMPVFEEHDQMLVEYYQSHFGISLNNQVLPQALANVLNARRERDTFSELDDKNTSSFFIETAAKLLSSEDAFSLIHEASHFYSFSLLRPAITLFNTTWSAIENLLRQAATEEHNGFWDKFIDLNNKLKDCLTNSLALEELRANIFALEILPLELQTMFHNRIYGNESESESSKDSEIYSRLQFLAGSRRGTALVLTLLAECLDPLNPVGKLE